MRMLIAIKWKCIIVEMYYLIQLANFFLTNLRLQYI